MATRIINGKDLLLSVDGVPVGCATSNTLSIDTDMIDAACKESGDFYDASPSMHTATLSADGVLKIDSPADPSQVRGYDFISLQLAKTRIDWIFGTQDSGERVLSGSAYITSSEISGDNDGTGSYSVELQVVGPFGFTVNP